jgi:Rrf2 family transcriptional regulator, cysteine metabolism repressor
MNLLARDTDYAVRALLYMAARKDVLTSTVDLDRDLGLPRPFMRKTLQKLQKAGYLVSVKGNKGGFSLAVDLKKVRLIELMRLFQGNISLGDCLFKKKLCDCRATCPLRKEIKAMEDILLKRLGSLTVGELAK